MLFQLRQLPDRHHVAAKDSIVGLEALLPDGVAWHHSTRPAWRTFRCKLPMPGVQRVPVLNLHHQQLLAVHEHADAVQHPMQLQLGLHTWRQLLTCCCAAWLQQQQGRLTSSTASTMPPRLDMVDQVAWMNQGLGLEQQFRFVVDGCFCCCWFWLLAVLQAEQMMTALNDEVFPGIGLADGLALKFE